MRSETLKKEAVSSETRQSPDLAMLCEADSRKNFGFFGDQACERRNGEIHSFFQVGKTSEGLNPKE
jgi:hypothetical protein